MMDTLGAIVRTELQHSSARRVSPPLSMRVCRHAHSSLIAVGRLRFVVRERTQARGTCFVWRTVADVARRPSAKFLVAVACSARATCAHALILLATQKTRAGLGAAKRRASPWHFYVLHNVSTRFRFRCWLAGGSLSQEPGCLPLATLLRR